MLSDFLGSFWNPPPHMSNFYLQMSKFWGHLRPPIPPSLKIGHHLCTFHNCIQLVTFFVICFQRDTSSYLDIVTVLDEAIQSHSGKDTIKIEFQVNFRKLQKSLVIIGHFLSQCKYLKQNKSFF